jgi:hypothetical protein
MPIVSKIYHSSTFLPSTIFQTDIPETFTFLPVAGMSLNSPWCVPVSVQ